MFRAKQHDRPVRDVLKDETGASVAEGLAGVALVLIALAALGSGLATNISAVNTVATKAEREALITSLVGEKQASVIWGTEEAPTTQVVTTPTGREVELTVWKEVDEVSTTLVASVPASAKLDASDCSGKSAIALEGCLYASRVHARTLDELTPHPLVRKYEGMPDDEVIGTVNSGVGTETTFVQGDQIASATDTKATGWRYMVTAKTEGGQGEIKFVQGSKAVAIIPLDSSKQNYFGTIHAATGAPVKIIVSSGSITVSAVYVYRAGGGS